MKREKLNTLSERDLLIGLITSDKFCREVAPIIKPRQLQIDYARIISNWIIDFYNNFKCAPKKDILKLYRSHCEEITDEALQDNVLSFIERLNKDYESLDFNEDYFLEQSIKYLKERELRNLNEDIDAYLTSGDIEKAENTITKFKAVEKNSGTAVSLLHNSEAIINSFTNENDVLFEFPGAYGKVISKIHREDFISFLAPMKRGKTWALMDACVTAMQNGLKTVFVTLEMSEQGMLKRFWTTMSGQVSEDKNEIDFPYFKFNEDTNKFEIKHKTINRKAVSIADIQKKQKSMRRLSRGGDIRVISVPAYSLTVEKLDIMLERLAQQENFIPDVIAVDYADIMSPSDKTDYRNQLDGIWKRLRGLAQKWKAVVFTASQSGRSSIGKNVDAQDIAEDIRKLAHVTSMVSLNQTDEEKENGILRLKQLAIREDNPEFRQAVCTQCLSVGRIVLDSHFDNEVLNYDNIQNNNTKGRKK